MAREEHDPLGHLRPGLEWQLKADQRSTDAAVYARLAELGALELAERFKATKPPRDALDKFKALLEKLVEVIRANPGHPGRPQSRWEREALQELQRFAGEAPLHRDSSEAPSKGPPVAMTASETGRMGGAEAQKRRREAGELAWTADALRIAKDARSKDPHTSTKTICQQIWSKCRSKGCPAPDEDGNPSRQLYRFIAKYEAIEDSIPRRAPYKERKCGPAPSEMIFPRLFFDSIF